MLIYLPVFILSVATTIERVLKSMRWLYTGGYYCKMFCVDLCWHTLLMDVVHVMRVDVFFIVPIRGAYRLSTCSIPSAILYKLQLKYHRQHQCATHINGLPLSAGESSPNFHKLFSKRGYPTGLSFSRLQPDNYCSISSPYLYSHNFPPLIPQELDKGRALPTK